VQNRDIILTTSDNRLQRLKIADPKYEPLQYVLMMPRGTNGWTTMRSLHPDFGDRKVTLLQYMQYRLGVRPVPGQALNPQHFCRLFGQYLVDNWSRTEEDRLNYIRTHQSDFRKETVKGGSIRLRFL